MATLTLAAILAVTLASLVHAQSYSYKITVDVANSQVMRPDVKGKLKVILHGSGASGGEYKYALSADTEDFRRGDRKSYLIAAPLEVYHIAFVQLEFTTKWSWSSLKHAQELLVSHVTVEPVYMADARNRIQTTKRWCATSGWTTLKAGEKKSMMNNSCMS